MAESGAPFLGIANRGCPAAASPSASPAFPAERKRSRRSRMKTSLYRWVCQILFEGSSPGPAPPPSGRGIGTERRRSTRLPLTLFPYGRRLRSPNRLESGFEGRCLPAYLRGTPFAQEGGGAHEAMTTEVRLASETITAQGRDRRPELSRLMLLIAQHDEGSFTRLYEIVSPVVFGLSLRILGNTSAAEDTVVDVFSEIWHQPARFDPDQTSPLMWITTLTRTRALERRRSAGNVIPMTAAPGSLSPPEIPDREPWEPPESVGARAALEGLPLDLRRVLEMAYFDGLASEEIAQRLTLSPETIRLRIRLGMSQFREALGPVFREERPHGRD
ncbi:MAG: sigma-70 family RNA polymerase sigma factor [Acidobacteriota bacterium]